MRRSLSLLFVVGALVWADVCCGAEPQSYPNAQHDIIYKSDGIDVGQIAPRLVGGLLIVVGLAYAGLYILKRRLNLSPIESADARKSIRIVETRRITQKTVLVLIEIDSRYILIAENGDKVNMVSMAGCSVELDERNNATGKSG